MDTYWYAVFCKPHKEYHVASYLQANTNINIYCPTIKVKPVNPRAAKIRLFFPRYIFINANLEQVGKSTLQWIPGAVGLVQFGGEPAIVPEAFIRELRERLARVESSGGLMLEGLKRGDTVKITQGPFAGYEALFDVYLKSDERVQVLLHWLGRQMKVKLNTSAVEKRLRSG